MNPENAEMVEKMADVLGVFDVRFSSASAYIKEDSKEVTVLGDTSLLSTIKAKQLLEENKDVPGVLFSAYGKPKDSPMDEISRVSCAEFMDKKTLHTLAKETEAVENTSVMSLFLKVVASSAQKIKDVAVHEMERASQFSEEVFNGSKKIAQKIALVAAIVGSGLLAAPIAEVRAEQTIPSASISQEALPSDAEMEKAVKMSLDGGQKMQLCDNIASFNKPPLSYDTFVTDESEFIRSTLVRLSKEETGEQLNRGAFNFRDFEGIQGKKFQNVNQDEWKNDGQDFQKAYLLLQQLDKDIVTATKQYSVTELRDIAVREHRGEHTGELIVQLINEKRTLKEWFGFTNGRELPVETVLQLIAPDGRNVTLPKTDVIALSVFSTSNMNSVEGREAYFEKYSIPPQEQGLVLLAVDMLKRMSQAATPEEQQKVFSTYKDMELLNRFQKSVEFAIEDNEPKNLWQCIAVFSTPDEAKKVFKSDAYEGLYQDERMKRGNDGYLNIVSGVGEQKLGAKGFDEKLSADKIISVLESMDLTMLHATQANAERWEALPEQQKVNETVGLASPPTRQDLIDSGFYTKIEEIPPNAQIASSESQTKRTVSQRMR